MSKLTLAFAVFAIFLEKLTEPTVSVRPSGPSELVVITTWIESPVVFVYVVLANLVAVTSCQVCAFLGKETLPAVLMSINSCPLSRFNTRPPSCAEASNKKFFVASIAWPNFNLIILNVDN